MAGRLAVSLFYRPRRFPSAKWELNGLQRGRTEYYEFNGEQLEATLWGADGPSVLLVHGWEGRRGQLSKIALSLANAGFRTIAIDGPAHGSSKRKRTTLVEFSEAVIAAEKRFGPFHSIVGHSFGSAASAIAIRKGLVVQRSVLISCPHSLRHVVGAFAQFVGLPDRSHESMYPYMEKLHRCHETELSFEIIGPDLRRPTLLVHDETDKYIPFADAKRVQELISNSTFLGTKGLGHMRILSDDTVVRRTVEFLATKSSYELVQEHQQVARS